jgi:hypothetical protein
LKSVKSSSISLPSRRIRADIHSASKLSVATLPPCRSSMIIVRAC